MDEIFKLIQDNIAAVFTLIGVIAGYSIQIIGNIFIKDKDFKLRLKEKILNRRIESHEQIIQLTHSIRAMVSMRRTDSNGELARHPVIFSSKRAFYEWYAYYAEIIHKYSAWLSIKVTRELNLFQDYIVTLDEWINVIDNDQSYQEIGNIIRDDLVSFSDKIEKLSFKYIEHDLYKMSTGDLEEWHKYPLKETLSRLDSTVLFKEKDQILEIIHESTMNKT